MTRTPIALVVDDEAPIREIVRRYLTADGIEVVESSDGTEALGLFDARRPDVVILDVMLPGTDGIEVLKRIRTSSAVPVLMLSARVEEADRVIGLSLGADDYLTKPFSPRELTLRVKNLLRRADSPMPDGGARPTDLDGVQVDIERHEVLVDGRAVTLTALEFQLLAVLSSAPRRVFTRPMLLEQVWGYDHLGDERVVDVHIRNLRRALGDDAERPRWIGTVRGVGYRFEASA